MGRARAWLRVALMQKKLADYLKVLVDNRDEELVDFFEPDALMMSDEAIVIVGLMVGLNVIDCNLCIKARFIKIQKSLNILFTTLRMLLGGRFRFPTRCNRFFIVSAL